MRGVYSQAEGILAEYKATEYLKEKGYRIIAQNYSAPKVGELDIVAMKGRTLAVVEVKYRASDKRYGSGLESVTPSKVKKIVKTTACFLRDSSPEYDVLRFDIIEVTDISINHIENAFYGNFL